MVKEWLFLESAEVSLLASQRTTGASGCVGGASGLPGSDQYTIDGAWHPLNQHCTIDAGEKCRILTPGGGGFGEPSSEEEEQGPI